MEMGKKTNTAARAGMAAALACGLACGLAATAEAKTAAPAAPTSVRAVCADTGQAKVTWKKVKGAKAYKVRYSAKKGMKASKTIALKKTARTFSGLEAGKTWRFQVKAKGKGGKWSKWSKAAKVTVIDKDVLLDEAYMSTASTSASSSTYQHSAAYLDVYWKAVPYFYASNVEVSKDDYKDWYECIVQGHTLGYTGSEVVTPTTATCTEAGKAAVVTCSVCGRAYGGEPREALGHSWSKTSETTVTCTEAGHMAAYTCTRCGATKGGEEVAALGHDFRNLYCARCGVGAGAGHTKETGYKHDLDGEPVIVEEATCEKAARGMRTCSICGNKNTKLIEIGEPLGHDYVDGKCTRCGKSE